MRNLLLFMLFFSGMTVLLKAEDKITKGTKVKILEIANADSYYEERASFLGKDATALGDLSNGKEGFYSGTLEIEGTSRTCFFTDVKVSKIESSKSTAPKVNTKSDFTGSIPSGTKFKISEISTEDSYYRDRNEIVGKTGTTNSSLTVDGEGYTSGSLSTDDGKSYYFYKVKLGKPDAKVSAAPTTAAKTTSPAVSASSMKPVKFITGTIKKGTAVYVAEISPDDSYYSDRFDLVGKKGKVDKNDMTVKEDGYYSGDFKYDDGSTGYFYKAKFSKEPVAKLEKPAESKSDAPVDSKSGYDYTEWDNAVNDPDIQDGDKVEIVAVSPEDSYYDDKDDYIGQQGYVSNLEIDDLEDGYGGDIELENGSKPYFYLVKLKKISAGRTPSRPTTTTTTTSSSSSDLSKIEKGTKVVVTDLDKDDSFYTSKEKYVGKTGRVAEGLNSQGNGCYSGKIVFDDQSDAYFYKVKVTILK
ncbi:MAG: hypothetical protein IPM95_08495 [Sphingobacteriales bacterium]|nr:hypothetical protein [Sphingobacteriales bacterium]